MASKQQQILVALGKFYQQPLAKVSTELILSAVTIIFFAILAIRPTLLTMTELIKEIEDKKKLDVELQNKIVALSTAQEQWLAVGEDLGVLTTAVPDQLDLVNSLKIIELLASERKIVIDTMLVSQLPVGTGQEITKATQLKRQDVYVQVVLIGDYPSIRDLVEELRTAQQTFLVNAISFKVNDQRGQKTLEATLTLQLPYFGGELLPTSAPES